MAEHFGVIPDGLDDEPVVPRSLAEIIAADLRARRQKVITIVHPDAPRWAITYRLPNDRIEMRPLDERAEKAAKAKKEYFYDAAILAMFCQGMSFMGEQLLSDAGEPLTFRDREVMDLLGDALNPSDAVRKLYVSDGLVGAVAAQLLSEAGYGTVDDVQIDTEGGDEPDPTQRG